MDRVATVPQLLADLVLAATVTTEHYFVKWDSTEDQIAAITATSDVVMGIRTQAGTAGDRVEVALSGAGIRKITYGTTVAQGDLLTTDSVGRAIPATVAGQQVLGRALCAGVVGDVGRINLGETGVATTNAADLAALLAATDDALKGAKMVGLRDAGTLYTAADVEAAFAEIRASKNRIHAVPLTDVKKLDLTDLATTAGSSLLGLVSGTFGSALPVIVGEVATTTKSDAGRLLFKVPEDYISGQNLTLVVTAGVLAEAVEVTGTVDAEVFRSDGLTAIGSDLCATAAIDINTSAALAARSFTITGTTIVAGDLLDIRLTLAINDTGGAGSKYAEISRVAMTVPSRTA